MPQTIRTYNIIRNCKDALIKRVPFNERERERERQRERERHRERERGKQLDERRKVFQLLDLIIHYRYTPFLHEIQVKSRQMDKMEWVTN